MSCFDPRKAWMSADGGRPSFVERRGYDMPLTLPCGQCIGCRVTAQMDWSTRIYLASTLFESNSFATFTYDDANLPRDQGLHYEHMQLAFKRLRKAISPARFQFYTSCEYGSLTGRPHYHTVFLGWSPPDLEVRHSAGTPRAVPSAFLQEVWGMGGVMATALQPAQCTYVAKHNVDKLTGDRGKAAYVRRHLDTGELVPVHPPCGRMSRGGRVGHGIGHAWATRWTGEVAHPLRDGIYIDGKLRPMPGYFDKFVSEHVPAVAISRETARQLASLDPAREFDRTPERLRVREVCARARISRSREGRKL